MEFSLDLKHASHKPRYVAASTVEPQLIWGASPLAMALAYAMSSVSTVLPWLLVNSTQPNSHNK